MIKSVAFLSLVAVALAANIPAKFSPTFFNNPNNYKYQQYQNNPYYNNQNFYNKNRYDEYNTGADYNRRYDYYNKDYNKYYQDGLKAGILRFENNANPDGSYHYDYETQNGILVEEQGAPRVLDAARGIAPIVVQGRYHYTSPEGVPVDVTYVADESGYHPSSVIIPGNGQTNIPYRGIYTTIKPIL